MQDTAWTVTPSHGHSVLRSSLSLSLSSNVSIVVALPRKGCVNVIVLLPHLCSCCVIFTVFGDVVIGVCSAVSVESTVASPCCFSLYGLPPVVSPLSSL